MKCVAAPSDDSYFLHSPTNSYQSKPGHNFMSFLTILFFILGCFYGQRFVRIDFQNYFPNTWRVEHH